MKNFLWTMLLAVPIFGFSQTTLLSEDFQSGTIPVPPWTIVQNNPETWHAEDTLLDGNYRATVNYDPALGTQNEWLITKSLDFSTDQAYTLKFEVGLSYYWAVTPENNYDAFVKVSTDGGTTWTQVWTETDLGVFDNWVMNPVSVDLSPYKGNANVKIAFQYLGQDGAALYVDNIKVQGSALPTAPPNCVTLNSPANNATNIDYQAPVNLTWTAATTGIPADSYEVYLDTNANPTTLKATVPATSYAVSGLAPATKYYWKVIAKNAAGAATGCSVSSFTTMDPTYCSAGATSTSFEKISNVTFADINNNSTSTAGYEDFTQVVGHVQKGQTYTFTADFNQTSYSSDQVIVWIDFNQDKVFDPATEQVLITTPGKAPWTGSITIPATALEGNTRMRIRLHDSVLTPNTTPCGTSSYGQVEDYTLNISGNMGVSDASKLKISIYPNPVKEVFNIVAPTKVKNVQIFDQSGKQVMNKALNEAKSNLNVSRLTAGVYFVKITLEDGTTSSTKFIKE